MSDAADPNPQQQLQISVPEEVKRGTYANLLMVTHTAHEFTLDFCQFQPSSDPGQRQADVVARIRIAPTLVGKVLRALDTNLARYEERFGPVQVIDE